jgi:hypothetical protein
LKPYLLLLLGSLLLAVNACSSPDYCDADHACDGYDGYQRSLAADCNSTCITLQGCDLGDGAFGAPNGALCRNYCERAATVVRYWQCEPLYRDYLSCIRQVDMCNLSECNAFSIAFNDCLSPPQPDNADSCVHANNGVCDEPARCVIGSDTTDCH